MRAAKALAEEAGIRRADDGISDEMRALSAYIANALHAPLPEEVLEKGRHHLLDTVAAMVSGSRLKPGEMAISYVKALGGAPA